MPSQAERLGVVETKVENLNEKMDELKVDVKDLHDCLDKTRDDLKLRLDEMYNASCSQHAELAKKISGLENIRERVTWTVAGAVAFGGIIIGHLDKFIAFLK
jgi:predicted nuclease with TOPRIM domain